MEEYRIVKETVTVTRFHIVKAPPEQAIKAVQNCECNTNYLHSCDVIWWDSDKLYEIEELPANWEKDVRLRNEARHLTEQMSRQIPETDLTKRKKRAKIKKAAEKKSPPKFDVVSMMGLK